jgi:hypothetical protein
MKILFKNLIVVVIGMSFALATNASAQMVVGNYNYGYNQGNTWNELSSTQPFQQNGISPISGFSNERAFFEYILNLYFGFQPQNSFGDNNVNFSNPGYVNNNFAGGSPRYTYMNVPSYSLGNNRFNSNSNNSSRPDVRTHSARDIQDDSAELRGSVDMNNTNNGVVFFVYGQDKSQIEDVEDDYDEYDEVKDDEESDDFEVERVETNFDDRDDFDEQVNNLDEDEDYYFVLCVEYEDRDGDESLECGNVEDFTTDDDNNNNNDDEPEVETDSANDIDDDSAELRGSVDMNDFNNGRVFFVWGEDEDDIEDVENENRFSNIDEDDEDIQKQSVASGFDGNDNFEIDVFNLDDDTRHYFRICVEYEDDDNDDTLECGNVEDFETDN